MSNKKKLIRENFRNSVFARDGYRCIICGEQSDKLDAHHITNRNEMPNGGYVKENGASLCPKHHIEAEEFLQGNEGIPADELYRRIGSSRDIAYQKSLKLK